jgi:phage-related protein
MIHANGFLSHHCSCSAHLWRLPQHCQLLHLLTLLLPLSAAAQRPQLCCSVWRTASATRRAVGRYSGS